MKFLCIDLTDGVAPEINNATLCFHLDAPFALPSENPHISSEIQLSFPPVHLANQNPDGLEASTRADVPLSHRAGLPCSGAS
jgi:hypothetical protein